MKTLRKYVFSMFPLTSECVMESAETQETIRKLMSVLYFRYWLSSHKRVFHLRKLFLRSSKHFYFLLRPYYVYGR